MEKLTLNISNIKESKKNVGKIRDRALILSVMAISKETGKEIFCSRFYIAVGGSVVYCLVWLQDGHGYRGIGKAGGYGYEKKSAAFEEAMADMGISFSRSISGAGESYIKEAIQALCDELGHKVWIVDAHA